MNKCIYITYSPAGRHDRREDIILRNSVLPYQHKQSVNQHYIPHSITCRPADE